MDHAAVACNFKEGTPACSAGALSYTLSTPGDAESILVLARSRSGRWIEAWRKIRDMTNFRVKTIPPAHPLYHRVGRSGRECTMAEVERLRQIEAKQKVGAG